MRKKITVDEANSWFYRNVDRTPSKIIVEAVTEIKQNWLHGEEISAILEIGCSDGRIGHEFQGLARNYIGIDPSPVAVEEGKKNGLNLEVGWADTFVLKQKFDVIILGFFLYLTHPDDWFNIAANVFDHLKPESYIVINDFYADKLVAKSYKHDSQMHIHKYSFEKLFTWHPSIRPIYQTVSSEKLSDINNTDCWYQTTILKVTK